MIATSQDHRIIDATSIALDGQIGLDTDVDRLLANITPTGSGGERVLAWRFLCCNPEVAVAFIRWAQDLKDQRDSKEI